MMSGAKILAAGRSDLDRSGETIGGRAKKSKIKVGDLSEWLSEGASVAVSGPA
jgi:hypothetical protein